MPKEYYTKLDVVRNQSIGWFIDGEQVKQVISLRPYKERLIGYLSALETLTLENHE